jgi:hypothetical protein
MSNRLDQEILDVAYKLFKQKGILATEMQDIVNEVSCSRATLYRHFSGKESLLLTLTGNVVVHIMDAAVIPKNKVFSTGYDALAWQLTQQVNYMINHIDEIVLLRDFDFYFTQSFPKTNEVSKYERYIQSTKGREEMTEKLMLGIEDGSIRKVTNPQLIILTLINSCIGMAQRILPREKIYVIELGYGCELLNTQLELLLEGIKNK